jgi:threonine/homoserine/homoserine lactone efflux protein
MEYLEFAFVMLVAQFSPGPDMLLLMKNAVNHPLRAGLWTVGGIATGLVVHTTLALTALTLIFQEPGSLATRLLYLGAGCYLGWLSFQLLMSVRRNRAGAPGAGPRAGERPLPAGAAFTQGLITNLLNPKAVAFLLGVLTVSAGPGSSTSRKLGFAAIIVGQALVFWSLFVYLLKRPAVRRRYLAAERTLNLVFGAGLAALAVSALCHAW